MSLDSRSCARSRRICAYASEQENDHRPRKRLPSSIVRACGSSELLVDGDERGAALRPQHGDAPLAGERVGGAEQGVADAGRQLGREVLGEPDDRDGVPRGDLAVDVDLAGEVGELLEHGDDHERAARLGGEGEPLDGVGDLHQHPLAVEGLNIAARIGGNGSERARLTFVKE